MRNIPNVSTVLSFKSYTNKQITNICFSLKFLYIHMASISTSLNILLILLKFLLQNHITNFLTHDCDLQSSLNPSLLELLTKWPTYPRYGDILIFLFTLVFTNSSLSHVTSQPFPCFLAFHSLLLPCFLLSFSLSETLYSFENILFP